MFCSVIYAQQSDIERIRGEIQRLERDIQTQTRREKTLLEQVQDTEREIGLRRMLIQELEKENRSTERKITRIEGRLEQTMKSHKQLKEIVANRIVSLYKRGRIGDWEALLTLESMTQARVWLKYHRRILENDERNLRLLEEKELAIRDDRQRLDQNLRESRRQLNVKAAEADKLEATRDRRKSMLTTVQKDRQALVDRLAQTQKAYEEIRGWISRQAAQAPISDVRLEGAKFSAMKGNMAWPVQGKVISKHGRQRHPELKTWIENLGIVIQAPNQAMVRSVGAGVVKMISWQRGMGNIVIVEHGSGYYTVYGMLDLVLVRTGQFLEASEAIGRVGDRDGLYGSSLDFQVWNGDKHDNPETWLR